MFREKEASMKKGKVLSDRLVANTEALAAKLEVIIDNPVFRVLHVKQPQELRPVDFMHYQAKLNEKQNGRPTLVLTQDERPLNSGKYNLGLRRVGVGPEPDV